MKFTFHISTTRMKHNTKTPSALEHIQRILIYKLLRRNKFKNFFILFSFSNFFFSLFASTIYDTFAWRSYNFDTEKAIKRTPLSSTVRSKLKWIVVAPRCGSFIMLFAVCFFLLSVFVFIILFFGYSLSRIQISLYSNGCIGMQLKAVTFNVKCGLCAQ